MYQVLFKIRDMKLIIEGDYKKVKQLLKELKPRCKKDKVSVSVDEPTPPKSRTVNQSKNPVKKQSKK